MADTIETDRYCEAVFLKKITVLACKERTVGSNREIQLGAGAACQIGCVTGCRLQNGAIKQRFATKERQIHCVVGACVTEQKIYATQRVVEGHDSWLAAELTLLRVAV